MTDLSGKTILVVGASRGLGHGIATALADAGASVIALARSIITIPEPAGRPAPSNQSLPMRLTRQHQAAFSTDTILRLSFWSPEQAR